MLRWNTAIANNLSMYIMIRFLILFLQMDEISTRFASAAPAMQMLAKEVVVMTQTLESFLKR
jgi:hypothetical protein